MADLVNPCSVSAFSKNTGVECAKIISAFHMIDLAPVSAKWQASDLIGFDAYRQNKIHADKANRWYPIFGNKAPVVDYEVNEEADKTETFANGTTKFISYGAYGITIHTDKGGWCLAQALLSFNKRGYGFIGYDAEDNLICRFNDDGTFSPLRPTDIYMPKPKLGTLTESYRNKMYISISPDEIIRRGQIFKATTSLLDQMGLLDVKVVSGAAATTTSITVKVLAECSEDDLFDLYADALAVVGAWVVKEGANTITVTGVTKNTGLKAWVLAFATQTTGDHLTADLATPAALKALTIPVTGYESEGPLAVTIP